jgi:4-amino-4-deoxy-L-arabinose transferase-like glycosyltransferase
MSFLIGTATVCLLLFTCRDIGLTWDEPDYFMASESYIAWFNQLLTEPQSALTPESINRYWEPNHEHPPLDKEFSGAVWVIARRLLDDLTAHRLGNILLAGAMAAILYRMLTTEFGFWAGLVSVLSLLTMPRFFFHAHLAALDVPAAAMIVFVTYLFWRTRFDPRIRNSIFLGIVWGLAISTKVNAFFLMPLLFLWVMIFHRTRYLLFRLALASFIGVVVLLIVWPWLYYDPIRRALDYLQFLTVAHWQIPQYYLGRNYMPPPWHFPFVMVWAVIPLGTTILYFCGALRCLMKRETLAFGGLIFLNALFPLVVLATGRSMVYDNERLFMPAFPFLAALAGIGFGWLVLVLQRACRRMQGPFLEKYLAVFLLPLLILPPILRASGVYPNLLSYYSESVGGLPGASRIGLETTYWSETYKDAAIYINQHAKPGDTIWEDSFSYGVLIYYQLHGFLRSDVRFAMPANEATIFGAGVSIPTAQVDYTQASFVILPYRQTGFYDAENRALPFLQWASSRQYVYRLEKFGVPIMDIYANP